MRMIALLLLVVCCLVSAALAMWAAPAVKFFWLAVLLSVIVGMLVLRSGQRDESSIGLLETPFYLSHDPEVFERYQKISQQLLRISQRFNKVYRDLALKSLSEMATTCMELGDGQVVFLDTETWRLAYEMLLRDPTVFHYRSIAVVRHPKYWQDAAGTGSMQFNFQLIDDHVVTIERIILIADQLWPKDQDLPSKNFGSDSRAVCSWHLDLSRTNLRPAEGTRAGQRHWHLWSVGCGNSVTC